MLRNSSTEGPKGAPPDTTNLTRPPKACFTVFKMVLSIKGLICNVTGLACRELQFQDWLAGRCMLGTGLQGDAFSELACRDMYFQNLLAGRCIVSAGLQGDTLSAVACLCITIKIEIKL